MFVTLPLPVLYTLAAIYGLLVIATVTVYGLAAYQPEKDWTELKNRLRSWGIIIPVFTLALLLNRTASLIFFSILSFLALKEYLSLIPTRQADRHVLIWAYVAIGLQYFWVYIGWYGMFLIFIPIYMFLFLPMRMVLIGETQGFLQAIGTLQWGLMLTVYTLSHLPYLLRLEPVAQTAVGGVGLLLYLVVLTELNDIAQFIFGKLFGRHAVIPKVSPGKTVEGLLGGILTTTMLAIGLAPWLTPFSYLHATCLGLLLSLTGFIGDVTVSALKRDLGIKDSGTLLPGHGGILDRIDSLTYTAPLFFHFTVYFYYRGQWL
ncbi:phosphatidate cytidylyltransferase [Trichothermofontia sichuanensis B231]|uniref:phosphatidate cytidylyltransferase n=1 Tax=Trichothermofontia sichuanensis TaxID=3045816 RepID=UPI002246D257|nr:phosphatidate cytidylyltransferase [Trichothermofontia sichuanensis]UZQ54083.1 phosphatidate cytidylyltransferase [Trichothermofontia sichuanensis B231]